MVATTAAWLVAQRDDIVMALILTFVFTLAMGIAVDAPPIPVSRSTRGAAVTAIVAWFVLRLTVSENVILTIVVLVALVGGVATATKVFPARNPYRTHALAFGTILVVVTLALTGYIGSESPDVTWFGGGAVHGPSNGNEVALTFDDGPNVGSTEKVMAILDANHIKGTFFEVGKAIDADPQITRALYEDGQLLGNHSYNHDQWRWLDPWYPELQRTQSAFQRAIGTCPVLYRPPHGDRTPFLAHVVRDHHMHMVLWSASAADWATQDAQLVARRILAGARRVRSCSCTTVWTASRARTGRSSCRRVAVDHHRAPRERVAAGSPRSVTRHGRVPALLSSLPDELPSRRAPFPTSSLPDEFPSRRAQGAKEPPARCADGSREVTRRQMTRTFCASWPFRPCATSNSTR